MLAVASVQYLLLAVVGVICWLLRQYLLLTAVLIPAAAVESVSAGDNFCTLLQSHSLVTVSVFSIQNPSENVIASQTCLVKILSMHYTRSQATYSNSVGH
jgi:hypothetical protein